jgi:hypothetical protein
MNPHDKKKIILYERVGSGNLGLYLATIWLVYVLISPIYVFPKGLPQPADFILLIGITTGLIASFIAFRGRVPAVYLVGMLFASMTFFINVVNYMFFPDTRLLLSSTYYPYNFLVFCFVVFLFSRDYTTVKKITYIGVIIAVVMQCLWATLLPDPGLRRMTGGFQNPNQLAYWSVLSAAMIFFLKRDEKFNKLDFVMFIVIAYIQSLALSKAGIISYTVMLLFIAFAQQTPKVMKIVMLIGACFLAIFLTFQAEKVLSLYMDLDAAERIVERMATIGKENDDSLEGRGYNRIWNNPHYLIFGAGEGAFERFRTWASSNELHSGLATIFFSYGVPGSICFASFILLILYRQPWQCWAVMFAVILFSASSQTIRFTHTWVVLGLVYATFIYSPTRQRQRFVDDTPRPDGTRSAITSTV